MSDKGSLVSSDGTITFEVNFVRRAGDVVEHIGNFSTDERLVSGNEVRLVVDGKLRKQAALLHSAGHAIDACMDRCGLLTKLKATKGYHFYDGPYVEYQVCVQSRPLCLLMWKKMQLPLPFLVFPPSLAYVLVP